MVDTYRPETQKFTHLGFLTRMDEPVHAHESIYVLKFKPNLL